MFSMGENVNSLNKYGYAPLHLAISDQNIEKFTALLNHPNIDLNIMSYNGDTPLTMSFSRLRRYIFITPLLEAGCDPNYPCTSGETPLHRALSQLYPEIALQLIKSGANLNALDVYNHPPLYCAIECCDLHSVCMLLYYGADAGFVCKDEGSLLMCALSRNLNEIATQLYNYYDDFSQVDAFGYTALHFACKQKNPTLALRLVNAGVNVNCVTDYEETPFLFAFQNENCDLVKLIWCKMDYNILLNYDQPFLVTFLRSNQFSTSNFLEYLRMVLYSPIGYQLLKEFINNNSFARLMDILSYLEHKDRISLLYFSLSFGFIVDITDINNVFDSYGHGDELEAFIYSFGYKSKLSLLQFRSPILGFSIATKTFSEMGMSKIQNHILDRYNCTGHIWNAFKYFSLPIYQKLIWEDKIRLLHPEDKEIISKKLEVAPEMPSLVELSRNKCYAFIHQKFDITKPYQFHIAVKSLNLPPPVRDIILFKKPLYE